MNIQVDKLRSFVLIAEERNLTKAAERRYSTPAAVSAQIRQLEDVTGLKLFERTSQGMLLTDAGRKMLPLAYRVIGDLEEFKSTARAVASNTRKRLMLGLNALPELLKMDSILKAVSSSLPDVSPVIKSSNSLAIQEDVLHRHLDAGFVYGGRDHPDLYREALGHIDVTVIAPPSCTIEELPRHSGELISLPWVFPAEHCPYHQMLKKMLGGDSDQIHIVATSDDEYSTLAMVKSGMGLGVLERQLATVSAARGDIQIIAKDTMELPIYLVARKDRYESFEELALFMGLVREHWFTNGCTSCISQEKLDGVLI